jgi:Domain of unknown function (DUF4430)
MSLRDLLGAAVAGSLAAAALAGCGLGPGTAPSGVQMSVTRDFGTQTVLSLHAPRVRGEETVMSLLMRNAKVSTRYGGGFVESIDGHSGGEEGGRPLDWFFFVNGEEAEEGAAAMDVHPGDRIWWDLHDWSQSEHVPAVVGSFPEPFLDGLGGKRLPVKIECARPGSAPCEAVSRRLASLGVPAGFAALGTVGEGSEEHALKVLVGAWSELRRTAAGRTIERGPAASGVYVRILDGGRRFGLLSKDGAVRRILRANAGIVAATRYSGSAPVWVLSGTDETGVKLAAASFDAASLDGHFAVVVATAPFGRIGAREVVPLPDSGG